MHRPLDIDVIFPIKDGPSARLMSLKAACLTKAGAITELEERAVFAKAQKVLADLEGNAASKPPLACEAYLKM
jgi:hypothetical protein